MLIEVICKGPDGKQYFYNFAYGDIAVPLGLECVLPGDQIEVTIKNDDGKVMSRWHAQNVYPATMVSVVPLNDGSFAVTDDLSNTYTNVSGVSMSDVPMDHIPHTNS